MKTKILKFPDGRIAVIRGVGVRVNKQKPILEDEVSEMSEKEVNAVIRNPKKFRFSKRAKKINQDQA